MTYSMHLHFDHFLVVAHSQLSASASSPEGKLETRVREGNGLDRLVILYHKDDRNYLVQCSSPACTLHKLQSKHKFRRQRCLLAERFARYQS